MNGRHGPVALPLLRRCWSRWSRCVGLPAHATYGARVTADEPQYLLTALSLAQDGDLDVGDEIEGEAYRPFHAARPPPQTVPLATTVR